jgi:hypothetical protein
MRDDFHDIGRQQHLEAKQEGATDANLVDLGLRLGYPLPQLGNVDQAMPVTMTRTPKISIPLPTIRIAWSTTGPSVLNAVTSSMIAPPPACSVLGEPAAAPIATSLSRST